MKTAMAFRSMFRHVRKFQPSIGTTGCDPSAAKPLQTKDRFMLKARIEAAFAQLALSARATQDSDNTDYIGGL